MSGGTSKQDQTQTFTDNRSVLGEGSNSASNGSTIANYVVDNGTTALAGDTVSKALAVLDGNLRNLVNFAGDTTNAANSTVSKALASTLNFGSDALGLAGDALARNGQVQTAAFSFGSDTLGLLGDSLARSGQAQASAFNFGSDTLAETLSSVRDSITKAFNFGSDASGQVADTSKRALSFGGNVLDGALGFGQQALDLVASGAKASLDNLQATQQLTADAYSDAKGRGALTDKILIATVVGALVVAALAVHKG